MNKKTLIIAGAGLAAYESYKLYSFYKGFTLSFEKFGISVKNNGIEVKFNTVITNSSNAAIVFKSITGAVSYEGYTVATYRNNFAKPLTLQPNQTLSLPITVFSQAMQMLNLAGSAKEKNVFIDISYAISTNYKILGLLPLPLPLTFSEKMNIKPYLDQISGVWTFIKNSINLLKK